MEAQYIKSADEQEDTILNAHRIKKDGCLSDLLISALESECTKRKTVIVAPKNIRSFQSFHKLKIDSTLLDMAHSSLTASTPKGFLVLINVNQKPIGPARHKKMCTRVKLTGLGRWVAFAMSWNISLLGMCVTAEIIGHYTANTRNGKTLKDAQNDAPFTMIKFSRRFPDCDRTKLMRTIQELEEARIINISKIMHCNMITLNFSHPLVAKYSPVLAKLAKALHGIDTLESTSRAITEMYPGMHRLQNSKK